MGVDRTRSPPRSRAGHAGEATLRLRGAPLAHQVQPVDSAPRVARPAAVDFGAVPIGSTATQSVALLNSGRVAVCYHSGSEYRVLSVSIAGEGAAAPRR